MGRRLTFTVDLQGVPLVTHSVPLDLQAGTPERPRLRRRAPETAEGAAFEDGVGWA